MLLRVPSWCLWTQMHEYCQKIGFKKRRNCCVWSFHIENVSIEYQPRDCVRYVCVVWLRARVWIILAPVSIACQEKWYTHINIYVAQHTFRVQIRECVLIPHSSTKPPHCIPIMFSDIAILALQWNLIHFVKRVARTDFDKGEHASLVLSCSLSLSFSFGRPMNDS